MDSNWFAFNKEKVVQALRYHFISRKEIKILLIVVNVFAVLSAVIFFFKKISPLAFLMASVLWFFLMLMFWFVLPRIIYRKTKVFKEEFRVHFSDAAFTLENRVGERAWYWKEFESWMESPHFFHLYFNSRSFFIVPKEAFEGDVAHEFRKTLRQFVKYTSP